MCLISFNSLNCIIAFATEVIFKGVTAQAISGAARAQLKSQGRYFLWCLCEMPERKILGKGYDTQIWTEKWLEISDFPISWWEGKTTQDLPGEEKREIFSSAECYVSLLRVMPLLASPISRGLLSLLMRGQAELAAVLWSHQLPSFGTNDLIVIYSDIFLSISIQGQKQFVQVLCLFLFIPTAKWIIKMTKIKAGKRPFRPFQSSLRGKCWQDSHSTFSSALISSIFIPRVTED